MLGNPRRSPSRNPVAAALLCLALAGCGTAGSGSSAADDTADSGPAQAAPADVRTVIAVSIDGLNPHALRRLGRERTPVLHRLIRQGASTLNARTAREQTNTLPNHTGMLTGRRIDARRGGHGVTWNDERLQPRTVQQAAGHPVASVFTVVGADHATGLFASKQKFSLFERSWDAGIDRFEVREDNARLVRVVRRDLKDTTRAFRFVHLSAPDVTGHAHGFMGPAYLASVEATDARLGRILDRVEAKRSLRGHTAVVVTSDHGGRGTSHRDPTRRHSYRIPFIVWGPGVAVGADLYDLNDDYAHPGRTRTTYADTRQPVRNAALANLVTDLLDLRAVPGSQQNKDQDLDWR